MIGLYSNEYKASSFEGTRIENLVATTQERGDDQTGKKGPGGSHIGTTVRMHASER